MAQTPEQPAVSITRNDQSNQPSDQPSSQPHPPSQVNPANQVPQPGLPVERIRDYRLLAEIGSGGMAVVYKGIQESLGRTVAIKALKTSLSADASVVARFEREALSVASFQHENLITLYDYFHERGALFMIMEYVEGIDLYDLLERCSRLPADIVAIVALQLARALDYAHFRGIIHRDVKPANVILSKFGEVKLTDFGIARIQQSDLTETGVGLGTPAYMSPEQIVGDPIDHRTDIWSLGVVCYQMLAGRKPFLDDGQRSVLQRIRTEEPTALHKLNPDCPKELDEILACCMKKSPKERFGSAQELVIALEQHLASAVSANYRARIVMFLREQAIISDDESSATLHPALIGDYSLQRGKQRKALRRVGRVRLWPAAAAGILLLSVGTGGGWIAARRFTPRPSATRVATDTTPRPREEAAPGFLRVLVHPWARVQIGDTVDVTTPMDTPISLPPGTYDVSLTNPYFEPETQVVSILPGKVTKIAVALRRTAPSRGDAGTSDGPPADRGDHGDGGDRGAGGDGA